MDCDQCGEPTPCQRCEPETGCVDRKPVSVIGLRILRDIAEGRGTHHDCHGAAAHGGRVRALAGLVRRGLIDQGRLTDAGRAVLAKAEAKEKPRSCLYGN